MPIFCQVCSQKPRLYLNFGYFSNNGQILSKFYYYPDTKHLEYKNKKISLLQTTEKAEFP